MLANWYQRDRAWTGLLGILGVFSFVYILTLCKICCVEDGKVYSFGADDMMICMRYAYNCAHGAGLVFNPGELVQGYTNLGWTLFFVLVHLLHLPIGLNELAVQLTNLVLELILVIYWFGFLRARYGDRFALLACFVIAFNQSLFNYAIGGFETTLLALVMSLAASWCIPKADGSLEISPINFWTPLWTSACIFLRSDGFVLFISAIAASLSAGWITRAGKRDWMAICLGCLSGIIILAGILLWQKQYYGNYLPNTYYLKCNASPASLWAGLEYVFIDYCLRSKQGGFLLGIVCYLAKGLSNKQSRANFLPIICIVLPMIVYVIGVGGDYFHEGRLLIPIIPFFIVCSLLYLKDYIYEQVLLQKLDGKWQVQLRRIRLGKKVIIGDVLAVAIAIAVFSFPFQLIRGLIYSKLLNFSYLAVVRTLKNMHLGAKDLIAAFRAGTIPYYLPEYRFHDPLGRCDSYIAHLPVHEGQAPGHNKFNYDYSLGKLKPTLILTSFPLDEKVLAPNERNRSNPNYLQVLVKNEEFQKYYAGNRVNVQVSPPVADIVWVYRRKTAADNGEAGN